nr:lipid II flippase MurJ [Aquabacterium sp. A08]
MLSVAAFLFIAKSIAAIKEVALAYSLGTAEQLDGHLFVFGLASWPVSVFAAALWFGLTPVLVKLRSKDAVAAREIAKDLSSLSAWMAVLMSFVTAAVLSWFLESGLAGLGSAATSAAIQSVVFVSFFVFFSGLAAFYSTWLMSAQRHANTLLEAFPAACISVSLLVWPWLFSSDLGVTPLNIGLVFGAAIQLYVLLKLTKADVGLSMAWPSRHSNVWRLLRGIGVALVAQIIMSSTVLVDTLVLGHMGGGAITSFSYASRIMALAISMTAMVIGRAVLPVFAAQTDRATSWSLAKSWGRRMFALGCAGALFIALFAEAAVTLLFERGAFTPSDTVRVAELLTWLGFQLPFYMASTVWFNWLVSDGAQKAYLAMALVGLLVKLVAVGFLYPLGAAGLAVSTVLVCLVHWLVVFCFVLRHARENRSLEF